MKNNLVILLFIIALNFSVSMCDNKKNKRRNVNVSEYYEDSYEESDSWDFGELDQPEFTEPSRLMVVVRKYGIEVLECYLSAKSWILSKIK